MLAGPVAPDCVLAVIGGFVGDRGGIVPDDAVDTRDTGKLATSVNLVDHDFHVQGFAALSVEAHGIMAGDAVFDCQAIAAVAVKLECTMAVLTGRGLDDVPGHRYW